MFCAASMSRTFDNPGSLNRVCHDALQKNRFTEPILTPYSSTNKAEPLREG
jgi:hypothetical protein